MSLRRFLPNFAGRHSLHKAVQHGDLDKVAQYIASGISVNTRDKKGLSILHVAIEDNNISAVKTILEARADIELESNNRFRPIHLAVIEKNLELVKLLIDFGANVNSAAEAGLTPLHCAAMDGNVELVELLIKYGAEINANNDDGYTALHSAAIQGHQEVVRTLIKYSANIDSPNSDGMSPLYTATLKGTIDMLKLLIESGANLNFKNKHGITPINAATFAGKIEQIKILASAGADLNTKSNDGDTPLHTATNENHIECIQALLNFDIQVNEINNAGATPLHYACIKGNEDAVRMLLEKGADPNIQANWDSPLLVAASNNRIKNVEILIDNGTDVNAVAKANGGTVLHYAAANGYTDLATLLIKKGANRNVKDFNGTTPLQLAKSRGNYEVAKVLELSSDDSNSSTSNVERHNYTLDEVLKRHIVGKSLYSMKGLRIERTGNFTGRISNDQNEICGLWLSNVEHAQLKDSFRSRLRIILASEKNHNKNFTDEQFYKLFEAVMKGSFTIVPNENNEYENMGGCFLIFTALDAAE